MPKTAIIAGYGPGISHAVAEKLGKEGFSVAILARNEAKLNEARRELQDKGIKVVVYPCDVGNVSALRAAIQRAREALGPVSLLHWNASLPGAGDLLTAPVEALRSVFDVAVTGLITAVQETVADLKQAGSGAVLVTNGGFGKLDPNMDAIAVKTNNMGLAIGNAAKHKAVRLLAKRLEGEGIFVAEVMVLGTVKGTRWDQGSATLEASAVAEKLWRVYCDRSEPLSHIS